MSIPTEPNNTISSNNLDNHVRNISFLATTIPIVVTASCFAYAWIYFYVVLGDFVFLADITDYLSFGAAFLPTATVTFFIFAVLVGLELNFVRNNPNSPQPYYFYGRFFDSKFHRIFWPIIIWIVIINAIIHAWKGGGITLFAVFIVGLLWGRWSRIAQENYVSQVWIKYILYFCFTILILAAVRGYDHGLAANRASGNPINVFELDSQNYTARLLLRLRDGYIIRDGEGKIFLLSFDGKNRVFLLDSPEGPRVNRTLILRDVAVFARQQYERVR